MGKISAKCGVSKPACSTGKTSQKSVTASTGKTNQKPQGAHSKAASGKKVTSCKSTGTVPQLLPPPSL